MNHHQLEREASDTIAATVPPIDRSQERAHNAARTSNAHEDLVGRLADEFSRIICTWLTAPDIVEIFQLIPIRRDTADAPPTDIVVPPNALAEILRRNSDVDSEPHMRLWAWAMAKTIEITRLRDASQTRSSSRLARLLEQYPEFNVWRTGGGCFAYRLDCDGGEYILMTKYDDAQLQNMDAQFVSLGRYAANGDIVQESPNEPIEYAEAWIEEALSSARHPKNVADYFAKRLGAGVDDQSLRTVSTESTCGADCLEAIDAAAAFVSQLRKAFGDHPADGGYVIPVTRNVLRVYWRG